MNPLRVLLLGMLVFAGVVASAAPIVAASHSSTHPSAGYVLQGSEPTPTPTPILPHTDGDECSGGGC